MKKLFFVIALLILSVNISQSQSQYLKTLKIGDSIYTVTGGIINMQGYYLNGRLMGAITIDTSVLVVGDLLQIIDDPLNEGQYPSKIVAGLNNGEKTMLNDTVYCDSGAIFSKTIDTATNIVMKDIQPKSFSVIITNTSGTNAVTWEVPIPYELRWANGTTPTQTSGYKYDIYTFLVHGNYISGTAVQNFTP